jgi:hypothetical protein
VRPPLQEARSVEKGGGYIVSGEEDVDEEGGDVSQAQEGRELNLAGKSTKKSLSLLSTHPSLPETQVLPPTLKILLVAITSACDSILASKEANKATQLIDAYEGHNNFVEKVSSITAEESLETLAMHCSNADQNVAVSDFLYMLRTIHLKVRISQ